MSCRTILALSALCVLGACSNQKVDTTISSDSTAAASIATDKMKLAALMRDAQTRGTFNDALEIAMQDTSIAREVRSIVGNMPVVTHGTSDTASHSMNPVRQTELKTARGTSRSTSGSGSSTQQSGDVLDRTERTVNQANQKIDQAARVKQQATDAKHKVDEILRP